jgi:hypothetical protein
MIDVSANDKIRRLFAQYDTDGTGTLDAQEIARVCVAMGQTVDATTINNIMRVLDTSGDGVVSLEEFQAWWRSKTHVEKMVEERQEQRTREDEIRGICASYMKCTVDQFRCCASLDSNMLPRLVQALGRTCRGKALWRALKELDPDGTRQFDANRFVDWYIGYDNACSVEEMRLRDEKRAKEAMDTWVEELDVDGKSTVYVNVRTKERVWENPDSSNRQLVQTVACVRDEDLKAVFDRFDPNESGTSSIQYSIPEAR